MRRYLSISIAGLALIIVTNAVALIGVVYNRIGESDSELMLTERELRLPYQYGFLEENSGIALKIKWRVGHAAPYSPGYYITREDVSWLNKEKLMTLGFDLSEPLTSHETRRRYEKMLPRGVFLVLEYDGDEYKKAIEKRKVELAEQHALLANNPGKEEFEERRKLAQERLLAEEQYNSRLFVIDVGVDKAALRAQYPDRSKYTILAGQVDLMVDDKDG